MPDLRLDTVELHATATTLDSVAGALSATDRVADVGAEAAGHRGLATAVQDFADTSARQRSELAEATAAYAGRVREAARAFEQAEDGLAAAARGEG